MDPTSTQSKSANVCRNTILIILILSAIILNILMFVYILRQNSTSKTIVVQVDSEVDRQKIIFDDCLDIIWETFLLPNFDQNNSAHLEPIRIKVFNTLRRLQSTYKRDLILFLYEHELIRTDSPYKLLDLQGSDLNHVQFENLTLDYLYLPGVMASNSLFSHCQLKNSNFQGSIMDSSRFIDCSLEHSTFSGASLKGSLFTHKTILTNVDFANTDLFGSQISSNIVLRTFQNTRLPDGSIPNINMRELILNGGAEDETPCGQSQALHWSSESGYSSLQISPRYGFYDSCIQTGAIHDVECYFIGISACRLFQDVDLAGYSRLIDNTQLWYRLSARMGCINTTSTDWLAVQIHFTGKRKILKNNHAVIKNGDSWKAMSTILPVPNGARSVRVTIAVEKPVNSSQNSHLCCGIDDISLGLFHKEER